MKFLLYPPDYDPMVASGSPVEKLIKMGITWTPEETEQMRQLEKLAEEIETEDMSHCPRGRWVMLLD